MSRSIGKKLLRAFLWTLLGLVLLLVAIPVLLYVPFVQDFAVKIATEQVAKATGMKVEIGKLRLAFPLKLQVDDATVIQANGDTMLTSSRLAVDVKLKPLFSGDIEISGAELDSAFYQLGNSDSVMWIRANIAKADINGSDIKLKDGIIDLSTVDIDGVKVRLRMLEDSTSTPVDTAQGTPWNISAQRITISNLVYEMSMLPIIDSLGCRVDRMELCDGHVRMADKRIFGRSLKVDSVSATYLYPLISEKSTAAADTVSPTPVSDMWTITADTLKLTAREGLYAQRGVKPLKGLDPGYIQVRDVNIEVDSFYNKGTSITVPLKKLSAVERCGLQLYAEGVFEMDSSRMAARNFTIETPKSSLDFTALMGMGDMMTDPNLPLSLKASGRIDPMEVAMAFPDMKAMLKPVTPISLSADIDGTAGLLNIYNLDLRAPQLAHVSLQGDVSNPFDPDKIGGELSIDGNLSTITDKQFSFLPIKTVPALAVSGTVSYYPQRVEGDVKITARDGRIAGAGRWNGRAESYNATLTLHDFPVDAFVPEYGVGKVTASLSVDGKGYNPMSRNTYIDADVKVGSIVYNKETYSDITLNTSLHDGNAKGSLVSGNHDADATVDFDARLDRDTIDWDLNSNVRNLNLQALGFSPTLNRGSVDFTTSGTYNLQSSAIDAKADVSNVAWNLPEVDIVSRQPISLTLVSGDSLLNASLLNGDMSLRLNSRSSLFSFIDGLSAGLAEVKSQTDSMRVDVDRLQQSFPKFDMLLNMGANNIAAKYLSQSSKMDFSRLTAGLHNDSLISINMYVNGFVTGSTRLDSISFNAIQHGKYLVYRAEVNNRPGTFDDFAHIVLNGFVGANRFSTYLKQENIKGESGFNLGLSAMLNDSIVTVKLVPTRPTIAYKPWTINKDNFISLDLSNKHLEANLALHGDNSFVKIFTVRPEGTDSLTHGHGAGARPDDLVVQISQVHLQDWLAINPFAPPIKGDLSADMRFNYDAGVLTGKGDVSLADLFYGRDKVGDFDLAVNLENSHGGKLMADVSLMVDSVKTITAHGVLNDSTSSNPFLLDFRMIRFPLKVVNPFIPQGMASLSGMLNGEMKITGNMAHPVFNGFIDFDTTEVKVKMLGTSFAFSEEKIPVDSGIVSFNDFAIKGCNENPLRVNGTVNARNLANLALDLSLDAKNIQVVKSTRPRGADVYGKAFLDLNSTVRGDMKLLNVNADLAVLAGTNVTYVIPETSQTLTSQSNEDMVHFVQFNDTTAVMNADSIAENTMALNLTANLGIEEGSIINVDLSSNGSNRIHLLPSGDIVFKMSELNGERMTGRININSGFVRYTPPFMSEKNFAFQEGSYVAFNGDMMNPILNIHAVDVIKANVTQEGQNSRLVNFDVKLSITNTLDNMNVAFDLSTDDDITVQNELASMSAEQRANQAMNMLLYNVYTGAGTKGNANLSGNQLYSFLTSQLNSWAANNIRGVDISFGIDQYDKTYGGATSTTTSYSYRVSKTFFNDRFKIVVGGNYSTDADADENFSQNLINDISFEYMLNKSGSMYIRIFRHTGYESILEGEITQTGVGFVLKKKLNTLWELFGIRRD